MCKKCKEIRKEKQHKFFKRVKIGTGLVAGGLIGMLFAPKKGREVRSYLSSAEFKGRLKRARSRVEDAKELVQDKAITAKNRFQRFWGAIRKKFGM